MKISVIIPAYNAACYIQRAVKSVFMQTRPADEIIVIDDGSTDGTADVVHSFDAKVRLLQQQNAGAAAARNAGIRAACGDWIAFLDADDEWLPEKLKMQCALLQRNPDLSWMGSNYYRCDCLKSHRRTLHLIDAEQPMIQKKMVKPGVFGDYFTAFGSYAAGNMDTMIIRKEVIIKAGGFCEQQPVLEDDDLWLRLAYLGFHYGFLFEPLAIYHLGVQQRLTDRYRDSLVIDAYMQRHLELSAQAGKQEAFKRCAVGMFSHRLRLLFTCGKGKDIRLLLKKYGHVLPPCFRASCYAGSFCPPLWNWKESLKKWVRTRLHH